MSRLSTYSQLYPEMVSWLPGCDTKMILQALRRVGRNFCEKTEVFRLGREAHEELVPQRAAIYQQDCTIVHPYSAEAEVQRVMAVTINGQEYPDDHWQVYQDRIVRLDHQYFPASLDDRMLVCGTAGNPTTIATWAAVTDGSVTMSVYGSTYALTALSFAACADMHDVARVIQNALNTAMAGYRARFRWNPATNCFHLWVESNTLGYMTAGTAGTDISGVTWLNGLTGATATLGGYIEFDAVLRPHMFTETIPDWLYDRWGVAIMAGAIADLARMEKMPWASAAAVATFFPQYRNAIGAAKAEERDRMQGEVRGIGA